MVSQLYYLLRSRIDGQYLAARPRTDTPPDPDQPSPAGFLLVFSADYDALSYLNAHAPELSDKFAVETVMAANLKSLMGRWNFQGLGMVKDPRLPEVEFFNRG
jgi:hypothetical protein